MSISNQGDGGWEGGRGEGRVLTDRGHVGFCVI